MTERIVSIQLLRGLSAVFVAGFHLHAASVANGHDPGLFRLFSGGAVGVDVFFVISGFIIYYVSQGRAHLDVKSFLIGRFYRIYPPYWVILAGYVLMASALALATTGAVTLPDLRTLIVSIFLLPYPDYVIIIAWTLSLELLFYAVFALSYLTGGLRALLLAMGAWVIASQVMLHAVDEAPAFLRFPLHTAVLEFLFGILIGVYVARTPRPRRRLHGVALVLGAAGILGYSAMGGWSVPPFGREIGAGVPAALLVYGFLGIGRDDLPFAEVFGESSYILYLVHLLYYSVVGNAAALAFGFDVYGSTAAMLAMLVSVTLLACAATVYLERPYQRWYKARSRRSEARS